MDVDVKSIAKYIAFCDGVWCFLMKEKIRSCIALLVMLDNIVPKMVECLLKFKAAILCSSGMLHCSNKG